MPNSWHNAGGIILACVVLKVILQTRPCWTGLGKFDIVLLVNALHEVFSDCFSPELGEIDIPAAKLRVEQALVCCCGPPGTRGLAGAV